MNKLIKTIIWFVLIAYVSVQASSLSEALNKAKRNVAEKHSELRYNETKNRDPFTSVEHCASSDVNTWVTEAVNSFGVSGKVYVHVGSQVSDNAAADAARSILLDHDTARFIAEEKAKKNNPGLWYPWSKKNDICYFDCKAKELSVAHPFFRGRQFKSASQKKYLTTILDRDKKSEILGIIAHEAGHLKALDSLSLRNLTLKKAETDLRWPGAAIGTAVGVIGRNKGDEFSSQATSIWQKAAMGYGIGLLLEISAAFTRAAYQRGVERKADDNVPENPDILFAMYQKFNEMDLNGVGSRSLIGLNDHPSDKERAAYFKKRFEEYTKKNPTESVRFEARLKALEVKK